MCTSFVKPKMPAVVPPPKPAAPQSDTMRRQSEAEARKRSKRRSVVGDMLTASKPTLGG